MTIAGDVGDEDHCRELVEQAVRRVRAASTSWSTTPPIQMTHETLEEITAEEWDKTFRTNIDSQFYLSKAAVPHMKPGGAIINTASINAEDPVADTAGLRHDQGRDRELHRRAGAAAGREGHPRELRRPRAGLDAADPVDDAAGEGGELRRERADGPRRRSRPSWRRPTCCWRRRRRATSPAPCCR